MFKFLKTALIICLLPLYVLAQNNPTIQEDPKLVSVSPIACPSYGKDLSINNQQVMHWKRTTPSGFRERGHIQGVIVNVYNDHSGHDHFSVQIGKNETDTVEVIYNQEFGALPQMEVGMTVEACGDFIESTDQNGPYPASPDGAILHWVHLNPSGRGHDAGYLIVNGILYGQDAENAGPKQSRPNQNKSNQNSKKQFKPKPRRQLEIN